MSAPRDPFPMSSPEAQRLAESVHDGGEHNGSNNGDEEAGTASWNSMGLKTGDGNIQLTGEAADASAGLMGGNKRRSSRRRSSGKRETTAGDPDDNDEDDEEDGDVAVETENDAFDDQDPADQEDEFLDRPLWESRFQHSSRTARAVWNCLHWLEANVYRKLYGDDLPVSEMLRTLCLAQTLFFMIGGYWLLRSLKDPVLTALCGVSVIPKAKMLSVFVVLAVVSIYNHFLDSDIERHKLFYVFGTFYFGVFIAIALLLQHPTIGLANEQASPWRILGWISYCSIESFGSVMVSLFWSFTNSNFSLETAKASYGVMVATAQVGSILGPTVVNRYAETWGVARCYLVGALCMLLLQGTMYTYIRIYGSTERNATTAAKQKDSKKKKPKAGILEGLKLFYKHDYVKGIFAISCLFMVEVTIVDFTMKVLASDYFAEEHPCERGMSCWSTEPGVEHGMSQDATAAFTTFMGFFGQATNTLSFLLSLLGTSAVIRYLGLRMTLLLFPSICLAVIVFVRLRPTLYVVFTAMMTLKACSYALNNPTKEMLYQPTSSAVRYKAKSWIDIFGARGSKALGSVVTNAFSDSAQHLIQNGSLVGMAVASFLIWNARFMGRKFDEYTRSGYIVGQSDGDDTDDDALERKNVEMASSQQEVEDTSCAIPDDDDELGPEEEGQSDESHNDDDEEEEEEEEEEEDETTKPQVTMV